MNAGRTFFSSRFSSRFSSPSLFLSCCGALLVSFAVAATAEAEVLVLSFQGHDATKVQTAVSQALTSAGQDVKAGDTSFDDAAVLIGCDPKSDACADEVLSTLSVDEAVFGSSSKNGEITVSRVERGKPRRQARVRLEQGQSLSAAVSPAVRQLYDEPKPVPPPEANPTPAEPPISEPAIERAARRPSPDSDAESTAQGSSGGRPYRTWAIVSWSGAGIAAVAGLLLWVDAGDLQDDIDRAPTNSADDLNALRDLEDRAETSSDWGNAMMVVGAGLAGVGTYLWIKDRRAQSANRTERKERRASASLRPTFYPGGGAGLVFTFGGDR
jgi:hypothetical protein